MPAIALSSLFLASWTVPSAPQNGALDRRAILAGGLAAVSTVVTPLAATAQIEDVNPANNYYFPMAKYRYLPRIFRAWVAVDELAEAALEVGDWEGMQIVWERVDDAVTALPLYTSAVEGSRSTKRKRKSEAQKTMMVSQKDYKTAVADLGKAVKSKNAEKARDALGRTRSSLLSYRQRAKIDTPDGGVVQIPLGNAMEAGHGGAPLGYVVPAFRGGGVSMDYALREGEPMMKNGQIRDDYRVKYQKDQVVAK